MEKKKEVLRRYKKARPAQSSSDSSSSSDSDSGSSSSYSSSSSDKKSALRNHRKKQRLPASTSRRSVSSSSAEERRKREKQHACQKKLEAKRDHIKRKLKEAKLKKRAAAAAAAMGHNLLSHRSMSPGHQLKMKKLAAAAAEKKHMRAASREKLREREREKLRAAAREREHNRDRSPTKTTKIRIHQDTNRKSPVTVGRHQLSPREKIIIQARTRERTPIDRKRDLKMRRDDSRDRERRDRERAEREAARNKEREEALARCQERQRERERIAREKLRREEEKKYERPDRLLPRPAERELAIATARGTYGSRERSLESEGQSRRGHSSRPGRETAYDRERDYLSTEEIRRREVLNHEERREREYLAARHRDVLSPSGGHYSERIRDERGLYPIDERERTLYARGYADEDRHRERDWDSHDIRDPRDLRDPRAIDPRELDLVAKIYPGERERLDMERGLGPRDWKDDWADQWDERNYMTRGKLPPRSASEHDWDMDELGYIERGDRRHAGWEDRDPHSIRDKHMSSDRPGHAPSGSRRWTQDWRDSHGSGNGSDIAGRTDHRSQGSYRRGGVASVAGIHGGDRPNYRPHPPPLMAQQIGPVNNFHTRFPNKRQMTYTNPNLIKKQQTVPSTTTDVLATNNNPTPSLTNTITTSDAKPNDSNADLIAQAADADGKLFPDDDDDEEVFPIRKENQEKHEYQEPEAGEIISNVKDSEITEPPTEVGGEEISIKTATNEEMSEEEIVKPEISIDTKVEEMPVDISDANEAEKESAVNSTNTEDVKEKTTTEISEEVVNPTPTVEREEPIVDDLSEISDSEDDILDKEEPIKASETDIISSEQPHEAAVHENSKINVPNDGNTQAILTGPPFSTDSSATGKPINNDDDDLLDFEEISDGELEEDSRVKGVGDALGVDWASLIKETKATSSTSLPNEQTTAKQKWQAHRIILDIGVSMNMLGEQYAKKLINDAKQKLDEEIGPVQIKSEIKDEYDEDTTSVSANDIAKETVEDKKDLPLLLKQPLKSLDDDDNTTFNVDSMNSLACVQVSDKLRRAERRTMIFNACGPNSRALSARQDLKLRRRLCGLPVKEIDVTISVVSEKMKAIALAAFQRMLEVK